MFNQTVLLHVPASSLFASRVCIQVSLTSAKCLLSLFRRIGRKQRMSE